MESNTDQNYTRKLPPDLVRQAQLLVCGQAIDVEDAIFLFGVLNLKGA